MRFLPREATSLLRAFVRRRPGGSPTMRAATTPNTTALDTAIRRFLKKCRRPAVLEPGEPPIELRPDSFLLEQRSGRLVLEAWDHTRHLARRIVALGEERPARLELVIERFGKRTGQLLLVDLARGQATEVERYSRRMILRERLRRALHRRWPEWRIAEISADPDLEHSLSPVYPRALLKKSREGWAALMAPAEAAHGALSFGLIWLDYLRRSRSPLTIRGLILFLPDGTEQPTCLRLAWLDPQAAQYQIFVYSEEGGEEPIDPADYGNLDTRLEDWKAPGPHAPEPEWCGLDSFRDLPEVECVERRDGDLSLRVRGLEFARWTRAGPVRAFDHDRDHPTTPEQLRRLAQEIARLRRADSPDRCNPLYRLQPEHWLESQVRSQLERIDPTLLPEPVYAQAPALAGLDRGLLDLLAVDCTGRLTVLELKAAADLHLPLQALDYWLRVHWHLQRGDFTACGYFPGIPLRADPPRLLLIAPALEFHPTTETILGYFSPDIEVERIGLGVEWRRELRVVFRARGAQRPER